MNGLPEGIDPTLFDKAVLTQVRIGRHEVVLVFDNNTHVTIESNVTILLPNKALERIAESPLQGTNMLDMLGQSVRAIEIIDGRDLKIGFDNASVIVHDSNSAYESFVITNGATIVVI